MRVSDTQFNNVMLSGMAKSNVELNTLMQQLYTGEKLTKISDDPVASIKLLGLEKTLSQSAQYMTNIESVKGEYQRYETHIGTIESGLQDANELILLALSDTAEGSSFAIELESLKESMVAAFNAKDSEGSYLFSGTAIDQAPFIRDALTDEWVLNPAINSDTHNTIIGDGIDIKNKFPLEDVDAEAILDLFNTTITELKSANPDMSLVADAHDQLLISLNNVSATHGTIGSGINNMDRMVETHLDTELFAKKLEGDLKNLNYDEAVLKLDSYMMALQASQKTYAKISSLSLFNQI